MGSLSCPRAVETLRRGIVPHLESLLCCWDYPLNVCTFHWWDYPHLEMITQNQPTGSPRLTHWQMNRWQFSSTSVIPLPGIVPHLEFQVRLSTDGIISTWKWLRTHSADGIVPHLKSSKFTAPLMGSPPLGDDCEPTLLLRLSPLRDQSLLLRWWDYPH